MSDQGRLPRTARRVEPDGNLAAKVAWMKSSLGPGDEAIETHFAWVFLRGDRAWKLRKPVRRDPMDYSTLEARHRDSEEEVRLNRRLAPHVYLGIRPLVRRPTGDLAIAGDGTTVDWLVEMRRLDRDRMLDAQLARGCAAPDQLRGVVRLLSSFYLEEPPAVALGAALATRLLAQVAANHRAVVSLEPRTAETLHDAQLAFIATQRALLDARAGAGCIVEAHGDLRPEHILLDQPPAVIDCLEFDRNLRILDRAEELEFLSLECARLGHPATGDWLARACLAHMHDEVPGALQQFYRSHRAATRAKLYVWRAGEPDGAEPDRWLTAARQYLAVAVDAARQALC